MTKKTSVEKIVISGSKKLYVIFGGIAAGLNMPPFEFFKSAQILNENKLFLRDLHQCWYHKSLDGISHNTIQQRFTSKRKSRQSIQKNLVL